MKVLRYQCAECETLYWVLPNTLSAADKSAYCPECECSNTPRATVEILEVKEGK